jgi:hypothetical protein
MANELEPNLKDYDPAGLRALLDAALAERARVNQGVARIRAELKRRGKT